jgi:hypothetical protein
MTSMAEDWRVLTPSLLQILDMRRGENTGIPASKSFEKRPSPVQKDKPVTSTNSSDEETKDKRPEQGSLKRPLLPADFPTPTIPPQRGFGEFLRAVDEVSKEDRSRIVDLFE